MHTKAGTQGPKLSKMIPKNGPVHKAMAVAPEYNQMWSLVSP